MTGGFRYRGQDVAALRGAYFYADYCSGNMWGLAQRGGRWQASLLGEVTYSISSFGEDERGELYVVDLAGGGLYRMGARPK